MKTEDIYGEIAVRIQRVAAKPMSIDSWTLVCSLMARGAKVAAIAKTEDISLLPFYRMGLKLLRQAPKEMSVERALETLDDSDEFYSYEEQLVIVRAFSEFVDRLEEWAESLDISHGVYWRHREDSRPWSRENIEDCAEGDIPPYYGWILVVINKIKNHFEPPLEPYANELNNNPFGEVLFAYQTTRQKWKFYPKIVEDFAAQISPVLDEKPLVGKCLAWGAPSVDKIPPEDIRRSVGKTPESESRYAKVDRLMAVYAKMKPSITRFQALCCVVKMGMEAACSGEADFYVWETNWLTAALQLLGENPCPNSCTVIERQNLFEAIAMAMEKIVSLFRILQESDPDAVAEEYDYFFQDVNNVMEGLVCRDPESGKKRIFITPDFVVKKGARGNWVFNEVNIRRLGAHCTAKKAIEHYRAMEVSESDQQLVDAANTYRSDDVVSLISVYLLFQQAIEVTGKLVAELEVSDDDTARTLVSDKNIMGSVFQPFFSTYYTPYTRYTSNAEKNKEVCAEIETDIKKLTDLIDRIFLRVARLPNAQPSLQGALKVWNKISSLYRFRMNNPFIELSIDRQEEYLGLVCEVINSFVALSHESVKSTIKNETETTSAGRESNMVSAEDIARYFAEILSARPLTAIVGGFSKEGRSEAIQIANTKMAERDWFSDPNLSLLFGTHANTIANWRKKPKTAPEGFSEAWERKDEKKMTEVACRYKAQREKGDAMEARRVRRNMSEEELYRERLK